MTEYTVRRIDCLPAKEYIIKNHYSHGCHNRPSPCYGLYDGDSLIGVLMFATPCSERVRSSVFGEHYKNTVTELHRLHILDVTPKNTESWFISKCLKLLKKDKPQIKAVLSFADTTEGHSGVIYRATNAYFLGATGKSTFFLDTEGRLRHPRQCGHNVSVEEGCKMGWTPIQRESKNRYLWILGDSKKETKHLKEICRYTEVREKK